MKKTKILSLIAVFALALGLSVTANAFTDMPAGATGEAIQHAVDAGLINGYDDDTVRPDNLITRAEMAAIITRAFGAEEVSVKSFDDVTDDKWYKDVVLKSVAMGAFQGDDAKTFSPERNITFQETYIVLSRVFAFESYEINKTGTYLGECDVAVLDTFPDKGELADWAVGGAKQLVGNGGWTGIDGKLKPKSYITRGEFAILMDSIVDRYIDEPGEYKDIYDECVMVRTDGVTITGMKSNKNLIICYSVGEEGVTIKDSTINGVTYVLGGADKSPVRNEAEDGTISYRPDDKNVILEGSFYDVRLGAQYIYVDAQNATCKYVCNKYGSSHIFLNFVFGSK